ncbi:hypothetical protein [Methanolobus chelungpuianus]|uniref:GIY-YIG domain-containing protein n=1 Tax=Methanolobus chelungpuianus TaxID=502115 RepID=A0AAE3HCG6_9EURY|nr:hypothetical protein [Methanolobus chelungpuianus]MCQ6963483.1 hypothetical protein [Methanolobus chelungpuianus]
MAGNDFTKWEKWVSRDNLADIEYPGIYCIALYKSDLSGQDFTWIREIIYVGMTNSRAGLKGRLKQFNSTINGKTRHGGADRFMYKYQDLQDLQNRLFVSVSPFNCDVKSNKPRDLRIMGEVAKFEYECFATYVEKFNCLPEFNDKEKSDKLSKK